MLEIPVLLSAFLDALLPEGGPLPGGLSTGAARRAAEIFDRLPVTPRFCLKGLLYLLEGSGLLHGGRFSRLPPETARRLLESWDRDGRRRAKLLLPLKLMAVSAYLEDPKIAASLDFGRKNCVPKSTVLEAANAFPEGDDPFEASFDVVVIGSGAGGAPAAREFARSGWSVAVVEEGGFVTAESLSEKPLDRVSRFYRDGGAGLVLGNPPILMPMGRAVGGTTVINSGTCFRTPGSVLDSWREKFGLRFGAQDWEPFFEDVERTLEVAPADASVLGRNAALLKKGAAALGLEALPLARNAQGCRGCGECALGCPERAKRSVDLNYLPQAQAAGAKIFAHCQVTKILRQGERATGVEGICADPEREFSRPFRFHARRAVVVAAGAAFTPPLLRASGFALPGLGSGLRVHPCSAVTGLFREEVKAWQGVMQSAYTEALAHKGILIEATFPPPALSYAEAGLSLSGAERVRLLSDFGGLATLGVMVSDTSSGRVRRVPFSRSPFMTYRLNDDDRSRMIEGLHLAAKILLAAGAEEVFPLIEGFGRARSPRKAEERFGRAWPKSALRLTAYHPMGTVRMGRDTGGLVDEHGRLKGARALLVTDASVFPTSLSANPQVTIMAFATRAARAFIEES